MLRPLPSTRRALLAGASVLVLLAVGCGGDDAPSPTTAAGTATTTAAAQPDAATVPADPATASTGPATTASSAGDTTSGEATAGTRVVQTSLGDVTIPVDPQRVVTIADFPMLTMFDLGVTPVGVYSAGEEYVNPRILDWWRPITKVSDGTVGGEVNIETIAALQPDLILGIDAQQNVDYDQLTAIAPTVMLTFTAPAPWRDIAHQTADVLGRADELATLQTAYEEASATLGTDYADVLASTTWDVLQGGFDAGSFWLYGPASPVVDILTDAGVRLAPASAGTDTRVTVSIEQAGDLADADGIIYYTTNDGEPANLGPDLFASPVFQQLPAAQADHLIGSTNFLPGSYQDAIDLLDDVAAGLDAFR